MFYAEIRYTVSGRVVTGLSSRAYDMEMRMTCATYEATVSDSRLRRLHPSIVTSCPYRHFP